MASAAFVRTWQTSLVQMRRSEHNASAINGEITMFSWIDYDETLEAEMKRQRLSVCSRCDRIQGCSRRRILPHPSNSCLDFGILDEAKDL
jgi:hypothetical protein